MGSFQPFDEEVLLTLGKSDKIFELLYIRIICHLDRYSRKSSF